MASHLQSNDCGVDSGGSPPPTAASSSSSSNQPDYDRRDLPTYLRESKRRSLKMSAAREMVRGGEKSGASSGQGGCNGRGENTGRGFGCSSVPLMAPEIGGSGKGSRGSSIPLTISGTGRSRRGSGDFSVPLVTPEIAHEGERITPASHETTCDGREVIYIDHAQRDKKFGPNSEGVTRFICYLLKQFIPVGALQWKDMPIDVRDTMFNRFMAKYRFSRPSDEAFARHVWEHIAKIRMSDILSKARVQAKKATRGTDDATLWKEHRPLWMRIEVWSSLCDKWNTEEWKKRSQAGRENRSKVPEANVHTSGSISFATQKRRMEVDLGREAKYREVFDRTHKKKGTDQYISMRSQEVAEEYARLMTNKYGEDIDQQPTIDREAWIAAAGPPKKGRVYGFGESLDSSQVLPSFHGSYVAPSSSFFSPTTTIDSETQVDCTTRDTPVAETVDTESP
ncbi:hypothetical protein Taro_034145 [Colocasia esculenta]|uniref:Transposase n=1 Tax=Colocasia esculenta TaxID=4460 RepID=A0A843W225_COLES|nr:hypothetical protein [Colocasia esculenta]